MCGGYSVYLNYLPTSITLHYLDCPAWRGMAWREVGIVERQVMGVRYDTMDGVAWVLG